MAAGREYRLIAGRYIRRRPDGKAQLVVRAGEVFEPTPAELQAMRQELEPVGKPASVEKPKPVPLDSGTEEKEIKDSLDSRPEPEPDPEQKKAPEEYLKEAMESDREPGDLGEHLDRESFKYPHHTGAGWYELSDGQRVRGKRAAIAAQADLDYWGEAAKGDE